MYRPKPGREQEQRRHSPEHGSYIRTVLPVLTVVFWVAASVCVAAIAVYALTQSMGGLADLDDRHLTVGRNGKLRRYRVDRIQEQP